MPLIRIHWSLRGDNSLKIPTLSVGAAKQQTDKESALFTGWFLSSMCHRGLAIQPKSWVPVPRPFRRTESRNKTALQVADMTTLKVLETILLNYL